jgi:hypothetical protein
MQKIFLNRFPDKRSLLGVYATAVFVTYGWTLIASFWKMQSWLFSLSWGEIIAVYSYSFVVNFLESALLSFVILLPGLFLPRRFWNESFIARGVILVFIIIASALWHQNSYRTPAEQAVFVNGQLVWWLVTFAVGLLLAWICSRVLFLRKGLEDLAERFVIFLYVYLPLTVLAFLIVFSRIFL